MKPPSNPKPSQRTSAPEVASGRQYPDRAGTTYPSATPPAVSLSPSSARPSFPLTIPTRPSKEANPATNQDYTPRHWTECFDNCTDINLPTREGVWRIYDAGLNRACDLALVLLHGGGHCALSWALVAEKVKRRVPVIAFDARGHGHSHSEDDADLSAETQVADAVAVIQAFFAEKRPGAGLPRLVICGHSMGGSIAVRLSAANFLPQVVGLVVIDVVEGTAMSALPYMTSWLRGRPSSFSSVESAIRYVTMAGHVRNTASARMSVPAQLVYRERAKRWTWRTDLEHSERYWAGWFEGLSSLFLSVPAAKMLVLANVDRLDKDLMIAQMQGKFQNILISGAGHAVQEDQPDQTAQVILDYLRRNLLLSTTEDDDGAAIFQQRSPIPPCC